jgi:zinc protease
MSARALRSAAFAIACVVGAGAERAHAQAPTPQPPAAKPPAAKDPTAKPTDAKSAKPSAGQTPAAKPADAKPPAASDPAAKPAAKKSGEARALPTIREWKLNNGLTVAHVERPGLPMVTVQVWYRFGSRHEPAGQHGAARTFERLMFMGSERVRSEDHRRFVALTGGETTALTTEDVTAFHNAVPIDQFEMVLQLEADRMRNLLVRGDALDAIRPSMLEELRRQESSPVFRAYQRLLPLVFTGHPYSWPVLGVATEIATLTAQQLKALYDSYFVPGNALLVVVGGVPTQTAARAVERWFGPLSGKSAQSQEPKPLPEQSEPQREQIPGGPTGVVMVGHRLPEATDADVLALQAAGAVLTAGPSSRLHRRLVGGKLADEVGGQVLVRREGGLLIAFARFSRAPLASVEKALVSEIDRLAAQGPSAVELRRAKGQILSASWFGLENATGLANQIGVSWGLTGKPAAFLDDLTALDNLSSAQVRRAAARYLARGKRTLVVAEPAAASTTGGTR